MDELRRLMPIQKRLGGGGHRRGLPPGSRRGGEELMYSDFL
jgi:hypothetical protein